MNAMTWLRCGAWLVLASWSFVAYGFVRTLLHVIDPGPGEIALVLGLSLFMMFLVAWFTVLWILPEIIRASRARQRRDRGDCPWCGRSLRDSAEGVCPECGPLHLLAGPAAAVLVRRCVLVFLGAWLLGAAAAESWARLDERSFRREVMASTLVDDKRPRWWPSWGSLQWDPGTGQVEVISLR
ncbi:MAG: hypothetical protein MK116_00685 [Phycisphaerales bacterium]|nr:hypothetical protein [Phycisphaerales bacterium]